MAITAAVLQARLEADTGPAERELRGFGRQAQRMVEPGLQSAGRQGGASFMGGLVGAITGSALFRIGGGLARNLLGGFSGVLDDYASTETMKMQLQSMLGLENVDTGKAGDFAEGYAMAADEAERLYGWVRELAIKSPFEASDIASALQMGMTMGFSADEAKRLTENMTNWAAATGKSAPEMEGVARAIGQIGMKGKVSMEELQQLGERGVPGLQILADEAGITTGEMQKLIETGQVDVDWAIESLVGWMDQFQGAALEGSTTLAGLKASFEDLKTFLLQDLFGPAIEAMKPALQSVIDMMQDPRIQQGVREIGKSIGEWVNPKVEGFVATLQKLVELWSTPMPQGPVLPAWMEEGFTWNGLPSPIEEKEKVDLWGETFAIITGWDAEKITWILDSLFPGREGAKERTFDVPDVPFAEMRNWQQFMDQLSKGDDPGDIVNAGLSAAFDKPLVEIQAKFGESMRTLREDAIEGWKTLWTGFQEFVVNNVIVPVINWIPGLLEDLAGIWSVVELFFATEEETPKVDWVTGLVDPLKQAWEDVKAWFQNHVLAPIVDWPWPWEQAPDVPTAPADGFDGGLPDHSSGDRDSGRDDGWGKRGSFAVPATAGGGNVIINGPIVQQPLDIVMLASQVARMMKQGRV